MLSVLLLPLLVPGLLAQEEEEINDKQLQEIHKVTGLKLEESFRCGLFFPDPKSTDLFAPEPKPVAPLFIFNATWAAPECLDDKPEIERYTKFCKSIWTKIQKKLQLKLSTASLRKKADPGDTIGDDICSHLRKKVKAPFVGPKSKKFPDGLEWGMYANGCGAKEWVYAGIKHTERVCCKGKKRNVPAAPECRAASPQVNANQNDK